MSNFLGINFLFEKEEIERKIEDFIADRKVTYVCAVNANTVTVANNNPEYKKIINNSGFNLCDGSLLALFYRKIYKEPVSSYPGPDFFIDYLSKGRYKSFFLGSTDELLKSLKQKLVKYDPKISDMLFYSPPFIPLDNYNYGSIAKMINESNVDIIWVSLGAPKQEEFMYRLKPYLKQGIMVGVGAAFTFYGDDNFKRAPIIMRKMHIEWVYRNLKNPSKSFPRLLKQIRSVPILIYKELKK
ncbi:WecB/TagA/CpsF family glycosyltransferase [Sulfurovum sp. AR]|uniref:WecB/TagA/CpsF family glycosyltransferase n=1 Tax=Sulfurovum sp. AR TaxID=1165841 RepID=UPI00025C4F22|nr:WecB/TagA/CpsF family glycosyltransferase [Sulfurovum sp. AR]EIF51169.1 glycosyl transferase GT26 family protein [Sulfurovum sp. AR]